MQRRCICRLEEDAAKGVHGNVGEVMAAIARSRNSPLTSQLCQPENLNRLLQLAIAQPADALSVSAVTSQDNAPVQACDPLTVSRSNAPHSMSSPSWMLHSCYRSFWMDTILPDSSTARTDLWTPWVHAVTEHLYCSFGAAAVTCHIPARQW
jgi:hypothetical protein